jgi:hypothetical protein
MSEGLGGDVGKRRVRLDAWEASGLAERAFALPGGHRRQGPMRLTVDKSV